jgi:cytochrome c peroxidase
VTVPLSPIEQLGKDMFFDAALSNPPGLSCAGCHSPDAGFTGPNSDINLAAGPVPGAVSGRSGFRKPQAIAYSTFSPSGPYFDNGQGLWSGGNFWDGHAPTNATQAQMPIIGPNEMANIPVGPYPPHAGGYSPGVTQNLSQRPYAALFSQVFGAGAFQAGNEAATYAMATQAIAAYEASEEVNPFSSKYDASVNAIPPSEAYQFTASEENGRQLFFGRAQCFQCHSSASLDSVTTVTYGREVFTMYCYANIGTPKNPGNPFYAQQDATNNPNGYNPLGSAFIDYGLGANPNPSPGGTFFMSSTPGDIPDFRGVFKAPSLRNVDKRPSPDFVKSYMHNGVFKSLADVVHFYNKRNIAVNGTSEVAFDLRTGPPSGYTPLFSPPEVVDNVQNVAGLTPSESRQGEADVATNGQIGNLELTDAEEADLVNFLKTLTDGFCAGSAPGP